MSPDLAQMASDWMMHILAGILLALFAYLAGMRRAEKSSVDVKDFAIHVRACKTLRESEHESDEKLMDQKLLRLEEKMTTLGEKVDSVCTKMDTVRRLLDDVLKHSGFKDRRGDVNP